MALEFRISKEAELTSVITSILKEFNKEKIFLLKGNLGAGKTAMVKVFAKTLGFTGNVTSPTYGLINEYEIENNKPIYHFDLYRIKDLEEALNIGIEDYLFSNQYCFIEWYEVVNNILPNNCILIEIEANNEIRDIKVSRINK
jgi:tRNA threonylcarbamoyladenosine biosynthesis protein TsaE